MLCINFSLNLKHIFGRCHYLHLTDEKLEAQRGLVACPKTHSQQVTEPKDKQRHGLPLLQSAASAAVLLSLCCDIWSPCLSICLSYLSYWIVSFLCAGSIGNSLSAPQPRDPDRYLEERGKRSSSNNPGTTVRPWADIFQDSSHFPW